MYPNAVQLFWWKIQILLFSHCYKTSVRLDFYDEGDEVQQQKMSNAIANYSSSNGNISSDEIFDFGVFPREKNNHKVHFNFHNYNVTRG